MIIIGIPTYNEADNIAKLTKSIDIVAQTLNLNIKIINADSLSSDNTVDVFLSTPTANEKISLVNEQKGKGRNIYEILRYVSESDTATGCVLIDGDITSFEESWLTNHVDLLSKGYDYVIPTYSRNYQEGNTTNHFVYPLLGMHNNGKAPRQPIAGDFGISVKLAKHMVEQDWHEYSYGYGVDIFLTLHALLGGYRISEVKLGRKIHKPSFNKMIPMFREVASSYYKTINELMEKANIHETHLELLDAPELLETQPISDAEIVNRRSEVLMLYANAKSLIKKVKVDSSTKVSKERWIDILIAHEHLIGHRSPNEIAESILPWYLLRVVSYLEDNSNAKEATNEVQSQFDAAVRQWKYETTPH